MKRLINASARSRALDFSVAACGVSSDADHRLICSQRKEIASMKKASSAGAVAWGGAPGRSPGG